MTFIFIDTSIFYSENFLEGKKINEILRLCEAEYFALVMPLITINEVKSNFRKRSSNAIASYHKLLKSADIGTLRNYPVAKEQLKHLSDIEEFCQYFNSYLDERLKDANAMILPYPTFESSEVFEKYFTGRKPFATEGEKKSEFPDAFALACIENWCKANQQTCTILSKDKDMLHYESEIFDIPQDFNAFLDETLKAILSKEKRLERLELIYRNNEGFLRDQIIEWLNEKLNDTWLYEGFVNYMDIEDVEVEEVLIEFSSWEIESLEAEKITATLPTKVDATVVVNINDEEARYYDHDDRSYHYARRFDKTIKISFEILPTISFSIKSAVDFIDEISIIKFSTNDDIDLPSEHWGF